MTLKTSAQRLPLLQAFGMVAAVFIFGLLVGGYFLYEQRIQHQQQLENLEYEILAQQEALLHSELEATASYLHYMRSSTEQMLMEQSRSYVNQAISVAQSIYQQSKGHLNDETIQRMIRESLRDVRFFDGRGYIFIDDTEGNCILLPTAPSLEGSSLLDNRDDTGHYIMRGLIDVVQNPQRAGFSRYRWYPPGTKSRMADKIAYVRLFEPYQWIIGTGDYLYRVEDDIKAAVLRRLNSFRFGDSGYISVLDLQGQTLINTTLQALPQTEQVRALQQDAINAIMSVAEKGGGAVNYLWFYPDGRGPVVKRSLVRVIPEWGWILAAGIYPDDLGPIIRKRQQELEEQQQQVMNTFIAALLVVSAVTLLLSLFYAQWLKSLFVRYQKNLDQQNAQLTENARNLELAAQVFRNTTEGIVITDPQNRILAVNPAFTEITGYSEAEALGKNPSFMASGQHGSSFYDDMWERLQRTGQWQGEVWNRRKDGVLFPEWLSLTRVREGEITTNYIATLSDISLRKANEERLRYLAEYDSLTNLPNRRLLSDRVIQALHQARHKDLQLALLFVDLDRFKNINDSLGHEVGDHLLIEVARRLKEVLDDSATVSRVGGDEFVILIPELSHPDDAALLARQILQVFSVPMELSSQTLTVTPSMGIAMYPADGIDFDTLYRNADAALYHAKEQGRNQYQFFTQKMNDDVSRRLVMENALRKGISSGELRLVYQPQYEVEDGRLTGAEALVRWQHPDQGLVSPDFFIPLAEETGLILELGEWVLREACRQGQVWREQGLPEIEIAVNVSALQFRHGLAQLVQQILDETHFPAENLVIEVTESTLMQSAAQAIELLQELKNLGVWLSLDDFGTGYSSLAYLKRFPLDKVKIDRAFISELPSDAEDAAITSAIIGLAKNLNLLTIAEGVETEEQLAFLQEQGCRLVQGFLLDRPLWPDDMQARLKAQKKQQSQQFL